MDRRHQLLESGSDHTEIHTACVWPCMFSIHSECDIKEYHLSKYENIDPEFVDTVVRALYVDDLASGKGRF